MLMYMDRLTLSQLATTICREYSLTNERFGLLATGFSFEEYTPNALYETVKWALTLYRTRPEDFQTVVRAAMRQDWGWDRSAAAYEALYRKIL